MRRAYALTTALPAAVVTSTLVLAPQPAVAAEPVEPANNDFANAVVVAPGGGAVSGNNAYSDAEDGEPNHGGEGSKWEQSFHSVWWSWTPETSGDATVSTCGSAFDTRLGVYTGTAVDALTAVAGNEDSTDAQLCENALAAAVTVPVTAGTTYHIAVDTSGALVENGPPRGAVELEVTAPADPGGPGDEDVNPGVGTTEAPVEFTIPRFKVFCKEAGPSSAEDCGRHATRLTFFSVEKHQKWKGRRGVVETWVEKMRAEGADITFVANPKPSGAMDGAVMKHLRARGKGGEVLTQKPQPGTTVTTTADEPIYLKLGYFEPAEDQKILDRTLKALEEAGEDRKNVRSKCDFIDTDAKPVDILTAMNQELFSSRYLTQKAAGEILANHGCGYEVTRYIDAPGATVDFVKDISGVDKKRDLIQLVVALPVRQDFLLTIREDPAAVGTGILGLGVDGKLTASRNQLSYMTVQVIERLTGRLVPGARVSFVGDDGTFVTQTTDENGETRFESFLRHADRYAIKAEFRAGGTSMVGFRSVDVVERDSSFVTMSGRTMSYDGRSFQGTQEDLVRARSLGVVPANLGTGLILAPTTAPTIQQITGAAPDGNGGWLVGQHNGVHVADDTSFVVGAAPGLVALGGGLSFETAQRTDATTAEAWPNPFAAVANALNSIVTGLKRVFEQGADGEGTAAQLTSAAEQAAISQAADALTGNGAGVPPSGLLSDKGLGIIAAGGGNIITDQGAGIIATGGLNFRDAEGNLIGHAGGNLISDKGTGLIGHAGGNIIATGGLNLMPVYGGNLIGHAGGN